MTREKSFSYLDLFGRPTLVITMQNVFDLHRVNFTVNYTYNSSWLLFKPALLIGFFMCLFVTMILYFRLDLSSKVESEKEKKE